MSLFLKITIIYGFLLLPVKTFLFSNDMYRLEISLIKVSESEPNKDNPVLFVNGNPVSVIKGASCSIPINSFLKTGVNLFKFTGSRSHEVQMDLSIIVSSKVTKLHTFVFNGDEILKGDSKAFDLDLNFKSPIFSYNKPDISNKKEVEKLLNAYNNMVLEIKNNKPLNKDFNKCYMFYKLANGLSDEKVDGMKSFFSNLLINRIEKYISPKIENLRIIEGENLVYLYQVDLDDDSPNKFNCGHYQFYENEKITIVPPLSFSIFKDKILLVNSQ